MFFVGDMTSLDPRERASLVRLFRSLSPRSVRVAAPDIPATLAPPLGAAPPRAPRAFLFDVYGTLVSSAAGSEPGLSGSSDVGFAKAGRRLERALADLGTPESAFSFAARIADRIKAERAVLLQTNPTPEIDIENVVAAVLGTEPGPVARRVAVLAEAFVNPCAPMPGARRLLGVLARSGTPVGLVSNAQFLTPILLEALFGRMFGRAVDPGLSFFSFDCGEAKPGTALYERAAAALATRGIPPAETLMIGNSYENDVAPARATGFMTALFAGDAASFRPGDAATGDTCGRDSQGALPDLIIASLTDLRRFIGH